MDYQGRGAISDASIDTGSSQYPPGVSVYDADGEQLGTVGAWQDRRNFLIVHKGLQLGHDTYIPHVAIQYSDMNGVHLRLRQCDLQSELTSAKEPQLPKQATPISMTLPVVVPDMGMAAVAAIAFADHAISTAASASSTSVQYAVEAAQDKTVRAGKETNQGVEQAIGQRIGQRIGQTTGVVREQVGALPERVRSRRWWRRNN